MTMQRRRGKTACVCVFAVCVCARACAAAAVLGAVTFILFCRLKPSGPLCPQADWLWFYRWVITLRFLNFPSRAMYYNIFFLPAYTFWLLEIIDSVHKIVIFLLPYATLPLMQRYKQQATPYFSIFILMGTCSCYLFFTITLHLYSDLLLPSTVLENRPY